MAENENNENNENEKEYVKALPTDAEIDELLRECTEAEFIQAIRLWCHFADYFRRHTYDATNLTQSGKANVAITLIYMMGKRVKPPKNKIVVSYTEW